MVIKDTREVNERELSILRSFYPGGKELTLKELKERTRYSYERINSYLKSLTGKKAVVEKKVGRTLVYSLNFKNISSKVAYYLYSSKRADEFSTKEKTVSIALLELPKEELDLCAIFGSYAKGNQRKGSDIDLLCVTSNKEKIETVISSIKRRYNVNIQPVILSKTEFAKIKNENQEFWQDLVNYGILFKGNELMYYHAYEKE